MPLDRATSDLESALAADFATTWELPLYDPNEVSTTDRNKRIPYSEWAKLFLPLSKATANDVATIPTDKRVRFTQFIEQVGYQEDLGNKTGSVTIDWSTAGPQKRIRLTGNVTLNFTAPSYAGWHVLRVVQDGTGGRSITWPTFVSGYPVIRQAANSETIVYLNYDGTSWHFVGHELNASEYNITDDPGYAAARAAGDFNNSSTTGFLTVAANRALALGCRKLVIPADYTLTGNKYTISDTFKIPSGLSVDCQGIVYANWSLTTYKPAIEIGTSGGLNSEGVNLILRVERATRSDWLDDSDVGIRCHNLWNSFVHVAYAYNFTIGFQAYSTDNDGWAYNVIDLGRMVNCKRGLALWNVDTASWVNQNLFYGGRFAVTSEYKGYLESLIPATNTTDNYPVGIYQYGTGTSPHNANLWIAPSFEIDTSNFATTRAWEIACVNAKLNRVLFARNEGNGNHAFLKVAASGVSYNYAVISYASTNGTNPADWIDDASDQGEYNWVTNQAWERSVSAGETSWQSGNVGHKACQFDSSGKLMVGGLNWIQRSGGAVSFASVNTNYMNPCPSPAPDCVEMVYDNSEGLCVYLDTENLRNFIVRGECASTYTQLRISIVCFDASGVQLTGSSPRYAFLGGGAYSAGAYGGSYQTGSSVDSPRCVRLNSSVKSCLVIFWPYDTAGTPTIRLKSISIASMDGGPVITRNYMGAFDPNLRYYDGVPSGSLKGNWKEGQLLHQYNPTDINDAQIYAYVASNTWAPINRVHIGTSAPADTNRLWVDTTGL